MRSAVAVIAPARAVEIDRERLISARVRLHLSQSTRGGIAGQNAPHTEVGSRRSSSRQTGDPERAVLPRSERPLQPSGFEVNVRSERQLIDAMAPLDASGRAYDRLLDRIGDARFVLLGEATHGTHEFYRERAILTERLIVEKGFDAVAVEADWPDAQRVNRFIQGRGHDEYPEDALAAFRRFPKWMWRNRDVRDLVTWLRTNSPGVGFYGLDLYGLHASIDAVVDWLSLVDPAAARRARERYSCFERFGVDTETFALGSGPLGASCQNEVALQAAETSEILREQGLYDPSHESEELFDIEMNTQMIKAAEEYYRNMSMGGAVTWNLRDRAMADTLAAIAEHLDHKWGRASKIVVWEHNSHLGDARATEMAADGEINVGQLLRERYGRDVFSVGFTTYDGLVTAAPDWGAKAARIAVRPAIPNSHELLLHFAAEGIGSENVVVLPDERGRLPDVLRTERLERAIGVIYRPQTERISHWFRARLADQFDALVHLDRTSAVEPLERMETRDSEDLPETYPFA
jgi:erythromycin esterase-like protein